jgi:DNA topoisomerase I
MKNLIIMESFTKCKTITSYLNNKDYQVVSCDGHIRNLSKKGKYGFGIDLEKIEPIYEIDSKKKNKIKELIKISNESELIFLATDHDREGEAIAFHLNEVLDIKDKSKRITFNEITKDSILKALKSPHKIEINLVHSQQARQMLDKIIGFRLSNLVQKKIRAKSAGRVQSVALKLVVEREKEIKNFIPEKTIIITASNNYLTLILNKYKNKNIKIKEEKEIDEIKEKVKNQNYILKTIKEKKLEKKSPFPFTTSTLLQTAYQKLNFKSYKTTLLAQKLYEGVQLKDKIITFITYPRTDSTRINNDFQKKCIQLIEKEAGSNYVLKEKEVTKKKNIQDAHECIRPIDLKMTPEIAKKFLDKDKLNLYKIIYWQTISSFVKNAEYLTTTYNFINNNYQFYLSETNLIFDGYWKFLRNIEDEELIKSKENKIDPKIKNKLKIGYQISDLELNLKVSFSQPPSYYNEASLIKKLEILGIGRPSTYSHIITVLQKSAYIEINNKKFLPTEKGILCNEKLQNHFSDLINEEYTSLIETNLDQIAQGKLDYKKLIKEFWSNFKVRIDEVFKKMEKIEPRKIGENCEKCNSELVERESYYGTFIGCSSYPRCKYIKKNEVVIDDCQKCKKGKLVIKLNKRRQKFLACNQYPVCKNATKYIEAKNKEKNF